MRRRDREITDKQELRYVLDTCEVVRLGIHDGEQIYVLPMNFGYTFERENLVLYVHGGMKGKKWDLIRENSNVAFEMDCDHRMLTGEKPCQYGYAYFSIMGSGKARILEEPQEKIRGLEILMESLTDKSFSFTEGLASIVTVVKITVDSYTGKRRPLPGEGGGGH